MYSPSSWDSAFPMGSVNTDEKDTVTMDTDTHSGAIAPLPQSEFPHCSGVLCSLDPFWACQLCPALWLCVYCPRSRPLSHSQYLLAGLTVPQSVKISRSVLKHWVSSLIFSVHFVISALSSYWLTQCLHWSDTCCSRSQSNCFHHELLLTGKQNATCTILEMKEMTLRLLLKLCLLTAQPKLALQKHWSNYCYCTSTVNTVNTISILATV